MVVQNLGMLFYVCGNLDEAEMIWESALAGFEKMEILEDEAMSPMVVTCYNAYFLTLPFSSLSYLRKAPV
jgi:Fe-S oxidoreductase